MNAEDVKNKIRNKGHWRVIIRPSRPFFKEERFQIDDLQKSIEGAQVRLRGWYYPHFDREDVSVSDLNKISNSCDWEEMVEFWEFTTSGQFGHIFSMREDYMIEPDSEAAKNIRSRQHFGQDKAQSINRFLETISMIYRFTEIFQFAANLAQQKEYEDAREFEIVIELLGVKDRMLYIADPRRGDFLSPYICRFDSDKISYSNIYSVEDLIGQFDVKACDLILKTFKSFNWMNAQERMIREDQRKLLERRI